MAEPNVDIVIDCHDLEGLLDFWAAALDYRKIGIKDNYALLLPENQSHLPVILQRVPEPKTTKTRVHFDIRVDESKPRRTSSRHLALAASMSDNPATRHSSRWPTPKETSSASAPVCR